MPSFKPAALIAWFAGWLALPLAGVAADCDGNLVDDAEEIALGVFEDCNGNGVPDACEVEPVPFRVVRSLPTNRNATGFHVADLDGDGLPDLALGTIDGVSVRLRLPDAPDVDFAVRFFGLPGRSEEWVGGDFDGDGRDELVAHDGSVLQILFNDGAGAFPDHVSIALSRGLEGMGIGDVNGDGRQDLVLANRVARAVVILENLGNRSFGEPQLFPVSAGPESVIVRDLDGDGDGDIVCDGGNSSLVLLRHEDAFRFATPRLLPVGGERPTGILAADLTQDGTLDLVTLTRSGVALLARDGLGDDAPGDDGAGDYSLTTHAMEGTPGVLTASDINGDGNRDVIASYRLPRGAFVFHNAGAGRLVSRSPLELALNLSPSHLAASDLDLDGDEDLVLIAQFAVSIVWNDGNENVGEGVSLELVEDFEAGGPPHGGDIGDLDGDGDIDIALGHNGNGVGGVCISKNAGDGTFGPPYVAFPPISSFTLTVVDLDGDGDLDIATSDRGRLVLLTNPGDGLVDRAEPVPTGGGTYYVTNADVDADGDSDLLSATGGNTVIIYRNAGDGSFPERTVGRVGSGARGVSAGDLDGDGDVDLAVASAASSEVSLLIGDGNGEFDDGARLPVLGQPNFVVATDVDGDGRPDAVTANRSGSVSVFWNLGGAQFTPGMDFGGERELYSLWTGDLTGDGRAELVTVTEAGRSVSVLVNRGDRTFAVPARHLVGSGPRHVRVADLDGDDDLDVVSMNRGGSSFTVLRNTPRADVSVGFLPRICSVADYFELSRSAGPFERIVKYVLPVRPEEPPLDAAFLGASRFPLHEEFIAAMLPERFPEVPRGVTLSQLVAQRATREFFVGTVTRRRGDDGWFYTFSVVADTQADPGEVLGQGEVAGIYEQLSERFQLAPLHYEPDTPEARAAAEGWSEPSFPLYFPEIADGGSDEKPSFELEIRPDTQICGVFPRNAPGRPARDEYDAKTTLRLVAGTFSMPTDVTSFEVRLVEELIFGPERVTAEPGEPGVFRLVELPAGEEIVHRFSYRQTLRLPGGDEFTVQMFGLDFRSRAGVPVAATAVLDETFFTFGGSVEGLLNDRPLVAYSSCGYPLIPAFAIDVSAADGTRLLLREQFLEVESELDTGPAALVSAEVTVGDVTQATDDYWRLVYAARRHNQDVRYWILLDPVVEVAGVPRPVRALEVLTPQPDERPGPLLNYLDEDFVFQGSTPITTFDKRSVGATLPRFRRGDVDASGGVNLADAIVLLEFLFRDGDSPVCLNAGDADDDGRLNLVDAVRLLFSITGERPLSPPHDCSVDPTPEGLPCEQGCSF